MKAQFAAATAAVLVLLAWPAYPSPVAEDPTFPHVLHDGLFPNRCVSCHGNIAAEKGSAFLVTPENCAACHNGDLLDRVAWHGRQPSRINLVFDHALHAGEMEIACADCHRSAKDKSPMAVVRAAPEVCLACHEAPEHLSTEADCRTCHLPLTEAKNVTAERIAAFPRPGDHASTAFIYNHGKLAAADIARCATCHSRDKCEVCHLNAADVDPIQKLARDPRVASLVTGATGKWPRPASHADPDWDSAHAEPAGRIQTCANCHSRNFCITCHDKPGPTGWEKLPKEIPGGN